MFVIGGVVAREWRKGAVLPPLNINDVGKFSCRRIYLQKYKKFPAILGIIMDKTEILSIQNLLCWKFAAVKILNTENCNFLSHHFF